MKMQLPIDKIKPNPFRDFSLYPIDEDQVERLRLSIRELGFFSGTTARPAPDGEGYELACGHHRLEAARREGLTTIEAHVETYDDADMVAIMVKENLTQRGYNAAAVLDSVAAEAKLISTVVLTAPDDVFMSVNTSENKPHVAKILATCGIISEKSLDTARALIAEHGPGKELIYRAINGFDRVERRENKDGEAVKSTEIDEALSALKASGGMAKIVGEAMRHAAEVNARRLAEEAARLEAEAAERKRLEDAEREAEAKAAEAAKAAEEQARRDADAARKAAERKQTADAEREAEAKAAQVRELTEARKKREAEAKERKARMEKAKKEEDDRRKAIEQEQAAQAARQKKVEAQEQVPAAYDIACMQVFRLTSHESVFRKAVLSEEGRRYIPKDQQLPLARHIRSEIDSIEKKRGGDLGSIGIQRLLDEVITAAREQQRKENDSEELRRAARQSLENKVNDAWGTVRRGLQQAESAVVRILELEKEWTYSAPFPVDSDVLLKLSGMSARLDAYRKKLLG